MSQWIQLKHTPIAAVDLFCGAGGLSLGLQNSGINVVAGIDIDPSCRYPFEQNIKAPFIHKSVADVTGEELLALWPKDTFRLLAGCAPCQPFSTMQRGKDTSHTSNWSLLDEFGRLAVTTKPDFITMENVAGVQSSKVFTRFISILQTAGYAVDYKLAFCPDYGLAQNRRRLVLLASLHGDIHVPQGTVKNYRTVRDIIGNLPPIQAGAKNTVDIMHVSRGLNPINLARIQASVPGGTWKDWPFALRTRCHQKSTGSTFTSVYGRMRWDQPSPTITTQFISYGSGRFGHPHQDRALSLREAAMLQSFPETYCWADPEEPVVKTTFARLIGNAVPPLLGKAIGEEFLNHISVIT